MWRNLYERVVCSATPFLPLPCPSSSNFVRNVTGWPLSSPSNPSINLHNPPVYHRQTRFHGTKKLGASALAWVMSTALRDRDGDTGNGGNRHSSHPAGDVGVGVDVRPLVGLLGQEGGDAASDAARVVLTGLAVDRPLAVIPEVFRVLGMTTAVFDVSWLVVVPRKW